MFTLNAVSRETCKTVFENYATFDTYEEARGFADRHEMEARRCGWTWVVVPV